MQFHRAFGAPVLRPVEDRGAEFDQRGVEREQLVLETEAVTSGDLAAAAEQLIEHAAVQLPGAMFVGVSQGGTLGRVGQSQVAQLAFAGGQPAANLTQRLGSPQMAEQHGHELSPATEPACVALGPLLDHGPLKLGARKQLQHLAENAGYSKSAGLLGAFLWQIYDNNCKTSSGAYYPADSSWGSPRPTNSQCRGQWLVRPDGSGSSVLTVLSPYWSTQ
jgi:hypothetical protein